jgi:hypothetical protein
VHTGTCSMPSWKSSIESSVILSPFFCALYAPAQCPPGRASSESLSNSVSPVPPAPTQCPPGRVSRILSDSISFLNSNQSSPLQCNPCICSMPTWQSFSRVLSVTLFPLMNSTRVLFCTQCACSMPSWQSYTKLLRDSSFCCAFLAQSYLQGIQ